LSPRERQVLDLVVAGETNKGVARHLDISERTVEIHRANVMRKMRARSLADLVLMAAGH
jgi:two-component system response regulator FixJ